MDGEERVKALAGLRIGIGAGMILAPGLAGRVWLGEAGRQPAVRVAMRALGARDLGLGLGALMALRHGSSARGWLEAGALADGVDAFACIAAGRSLPRRSRYLVPLAAGAAAAANLLAARSDA